MATLVYGTYVPAQFISMSLTTIQCSISVANNFSGSYFISFSTTWADLVSGFFRPFSIENIHGKQLSESVIVGQESVCHLVHFCEFWLPMLSYRLKKKKKRKITCEWEN